MHHHHLRLDETAPQSGGGGETAVASRGEPGGEVRRGEAAVDEAAGAEPAAGCGAWPPGRLE